MLNKPATAAALAVKESMYTCDGDLTPFWLREDPCECRRCHDLAKKGRKLLVDGTCLATDDAIKARVKVRHDRDLRWELVAELEADWDYAYWRCYERYEEWDKQDARFEAQDQKRDWLEGKLAA